MAASSAPDGRLSELFTKVFFVDVIREMIIDYVIHDGKKVLIPEVCLIRRVSKDWLRSATKLLAKSQKAVFRIQVTRENSTSGNYYVEKNGKILDQFLKSVTLSNCKLASIYAIIVSPDFFEDQNNDEHLLDCLTKCDDSLVELDFPFPMRHPFKPLKPNTSLSQLISFSVNITDSFLVNKAIPFLQSVFDATQRLTSFTLKWRLPVPLNYVLLALANFVFPTSAANISFFCPLDVSHLGVLLRSTISNLKTLSLKGRSGKDSAQLVYNILEKCSETLETFDLSVEASELSLVIGTFCFFQIPLMKKLKSFSLKNGEISLEDSVSRLPVLQHLALPEQHLFRRWTNPCYYDSVSSLTISWHNSTISVPISFTLAILPIAFPNLFKLDVTLDDLQALKGIKVIWREMIILRDLTIRFKNYGKLVDENPWDALLTGLPQTQLKVLMENPDLRNETELSCYPDSIRNLTDLERLHLEALFQRNTLFISDATFHFAFMRMPKLHKLTLGRGFHASPEMTELWRGKERFIENLGNAYR